MINKCISYVLLFALLLTVLSTVFSDKVSAVSDYDNTVVITDTLVISRDGSSQDITETYISILQQQCSSDRFQNIQNVLQNGSYAISMQQSSTNFYFVLVGSSQPSGASFSSGLKTDNSNLYATIEFNLSGNVSATCSVLGDYGAWRIAYGNITMLHTTNYTITYPEGYEGVVINPSTDSFNNIEPRCDTWDVACWFNSTTTSFVDGLKSFGEWISSIILPTNKDHSFDKKFTDFFTNINQKITDKLGILLFPFEFTTSLFNTITSVYTYSSYGCEYENHLYTFCTVYIPNLLSDVDVGFNLGVIEQRFPELWEASTTILRFAWVVGFVSFLHTKYYSIVRS